MKSIVISGYSLRAPNSSSVEEFAKALLNGEDLTTSHTRYPDGHLGLPPRQGLLKDEDITRFNASFFGMNYNQAEATDPSIRILLQVSYEALMDAQINIQSFRGSKTGVYVGHSFSDTLGFLTGPSNPKKNGYEVVNSSGCMMSNRLSYFFDLKGPSLTIDTGCSSSLIALDRAVKDIEAGIIDSALVAGANLTLDPNRSASFNVFNMLSPTGRCYSYDTRANGYCRSEGIACIVVELGSDGYARIGGTGTNSDGATVQGITYPSAQLQMELMLSVFEKSMIDPKTVSYHEGHGTGTVAGDKEELNALSRVYSHHMHIGSVKSNMGHSESASGLFGLIKILLMHEDKMIYPNFDWKKSDHNAILSGKLSVVQSCQPWEKATCTLSNFGLGGSNAFAILLPTPRKGKFPLNRSFCSRLHQLPQRQPASRPFLASLPESNTSTMMNKTASSTKLMSQYAKYYCIQRHLHNNRPFHYEQVNGEWNEESPLVFVLDGQGSQWNKMGQDLMKNNAVFCATIKRLERESGIPLIELYEDGTKWMEKTKGVIGIVSFQLGLIAVLDSHGISPDYFLGHSLGEIVCAFLAGLQTEAEVMQVAKLRSSLTTLIETDSRLDLYPKSEIQDESNADIFSSQHHIKKVRLNAPIDPNVVSSFSMRGTMAVIGCDAATLERMIKQIGLHETCVACYNSPKGQTISGPSGEVNKLLKEVLQVNSETFIRILPTDNVAYHAPYLEVFRDHLSQEFTKKFRSIENKTLPSSWVSTSRGKSFDVNYIVNNICGKVHFQEAIESLPKSSTVVEIGPSSSLLGQINRVRSDLNLIQFVKQNKPVDLSNILNILKLQFSSDAEEHLSTDMGCAKVWNLNYKERYPNIWGSQTVFKLPTWQDYSGRSEFKLRGSENNEALISHEVGYNLCEAPWSSILDHNIRGQVLFPAAGFLHALWSLQGFKGNTEFINVKVKTPLLISPSQKEIKLRVNRIGEYCEVRALDNNCHVTAFIKQILPTTQKIKPLSNPGNEGLEGNHFYSHVRRLGYNYGPTYRILDSVMPSYAKFGKNPQDWICYLDACIHLALYKTRSFFYPTGFDRVAFWGERLHDACMWVQQKTDGSFGNQTILLEGIQKEFSPGISQSISTYTEKFVKYHESDTAEDPSSIVALLNRESSTFHIVEPITSPGLKEIVKLIQCMSPFANESKQSTNLVISEGEYTDAQLLLTTTNNGTEAFENFPHYVVARWGEICLLRYKCTNDLVVKPNIVTDWMNVPQSAEPFFWHGDGASGAVACLLDEREDTKAMSYEGGSRDNLIGLEKLMRYNYIHNGAHGCWVDVKDKIDKDQMQMTSHAALQISRPGILESLEWYGLNSGDYFVEIMASALNFRDIMRAMGQLKEEDLSLGVEFCGVNVLTKERIFGLGRQGVGTHSNPFYSFPTPEYLSDEEAATIPVVYLTVYYALFEKANVKEGQSILIHAGAGGVGMAAIAVAQSRGMKIFTTCSSKKKAFLKERFDLNDDQIGDSRSDDFVNTILKGTYQRGVDVVLNQLAGELQVASLRCVAAGGHFCEIGKYDVMQNTAISQGLMANNVSFHIIDVLPMFKDPTYKPMWDKFLRDGFERKEIVPLPTTLFSANNVVEAFRYMSQGKHIGKIIINGYRSCEFPVHCNQLTMQGQIHLITGGLGGVGLALAYRLASLRCKELILVSRRGVTSNYQRQQISEMKAMDCKVQVLQSDVTNLETSLASPDCIWHTATLYKNVVFNKVTKENWEYVTQPKVGGYIKLRKCWPNTQIIVTSSVNSYFGGRTIDGQTSYCWSNAFLDQAARNDAKTLSVRLGAIDDVGYATKSDSNRKIFDMCSYTPMKINDVIDHLFQLSEMHQSGVFGIYSITDRTSPNGMHGIRRDKRNLKYSLVDAQNLMATVMGGKPSQYHRHLRLNEVGLDSLSRLEVVHHIHEVTGSKSFKAIDINSSFIVGDIVSAVVSGSEIKNLNDPNQIDVSIEDNVETTCKSQDNSQNGHNHGPREENDIFSHEENKQNSVSVRDFVGNKVLENENADFSVIIKVEPHNIDFDVVIKALTRAKFVIFRQSDPTIFNHGAPLDSEKDAITSYMDQYVVLAQALMVSKAIIIVVVEGEVRGGGMIFPAMADICIATPTSTFGLPEIHRGMVPAVVSHALKDRLGSTITRRLALTGEPVVADNALQLSLIDSIVEDSKLESYIGNMLRRWKPRVAAAHFIKNDLLPRSGASVIAVGTSVGTWLQKQRVRELKLDNREVLRISLTDGVATLTMCDEITLNSASFEMSEAIRSIIPRIRAEAKVVILCSSLENFHLGIQASIARRFSKRPIHEIAAAVKEMFAGFVELAQLGIPIIGILNGKAFGGGVPISLWCDYRIVTSDVDLHVGNISRGVSPCGQLSCLLGEYFPKAEVMRHYLGNSHWYAKDLLRFGIVDHVKKSKTDAMKEACALAGFIADQPAQGIRDTMHLMKVSYAADVVDEEAWLMAEKITQVGETFAKKDHGSFHFDEGGNILVEESKRLVPQLAQENSSVVGIVAIETYVPNYYIDANVLEEKGIPAKTKNGDEAVSVWDGQEDVISMALNAVSKLLERHVKDPRIIGRIEVGSESNVDMSKSIKSYIMDLMPEGHRNIEGVDNTNACYGGAAAMMNTLSWCRESGGRYGIVVATDTADMDLCDSAWRGASAVAMLIGPNPWIEVQPERVSHFKNTHDFLKPRYSPRISPYVQGETSVENYIEALDFTIKEFKKLHDTDPASFDTLVFHGGMSIGFQKIIERHLLMNVCSKKTWQTTFEMSRNFGSKMGGLYTASMFVRLLSLLDSYNSSKKFKELPSINHIGLFAYGSGSASTLLHAKIHHERKHDIDLGFKLAARTHIAFEVLSDITKAHAKGIAEMTLPRLRGVFYYDVSKKNQILRRYFQEGTMKRLDPQSFEPYMMSALDKKISIEEHDQSRVSVESSSRQEENNNQASPYIHARIATLISFVVGIVWCIGSSIMYKPPDILLDIVQTVISTMVVCSMIHFSIHRLSVQNGSGIYHPVSCAHFVQAFMTYISYIVMYTISPKMFHKHCIYVAIGWIVYIALAMVSSQDTWDTIDHKQRLFWIIHHNISFLLLGMHPITSSSGHDPWDDVSIHVCFVYLIAQMWNVVINIYRQMFGNGRFTQHQITAMRVLSTIAEKVQQIYAMSLLFFLSEEVFWSFFLSLVVLTGVEFYFQLYSLYHPLRTFLLEGDFHLKGD